MSQCEAAASSSQVNPQVMAGKKRSPWDEVLRPGARQLLVKAVEAEVTASIEDPQQEVDEDGRRLVVRNGHARERTIVSGVGPLTIQAPRVDDRRVDEQGRRLRCTSQILPPYLRRTKSVEQLIPWRYLKGISTGAVSAALEALLGPDAPGLSAPTVVRLKEVWRREYEAWSKPWTVARTYLKRSSPRRLRAWRKTARCCWLATTFRPSPGCTCGRRIRSSPPLRRSVCDSDERRVAAAGKRRSRWSSCWPAKPSAAGDASTGPTSLFTS